MKYASEIIRVPTKKDSRTSETQKRMYSNPDGIAFELMAKDPLTSTLRELDELHNSTTEKDGIDVDLDFAAAVRQLRSMHPRAA